ncbi:MAG TPA: chemotaxis protein CheB, partial [Thermoleophilia bacterium]|nr:chemotaxis protein CheB [Thermoleophilia bacterium]
MNVTRPAAGRRRSAGTSAAGSRRKDGACPVVGIGASAGGLEAFSQLLEHLPNDTGMAFVFVQHLDPQHASLLTELLGRKSHMPVAEVSDDAVVAANRVYVIPPNADLRIDNDHLRLTARTASAGRHLPIDSFLLSLATERGERAIGVILSGAASDGSRGLAAVKSAGGVTFAQDPATAAYTGMPRSAIAARVVDFVLTPQEIAHELARIGHHPYVAQSEPPPAAAAPHERDSDAFDAIFAALRAAFGVDFTEYKLPTIRRRVARRMLLRKIEAVDDYAAYLAAHDAEVDALYHDILIMVTEFFRDPETYAALRRRVFPAVLAGRDQRSPIRIWVPGCATGEEAYSLAISLHEMISEQPGGPGIKLFATDINERDLEKARAGIYPESAITSVAPEHLRLYFTKVDGGYQVNNSIRETCVFARHDVTRDPPFSRLDLVSCRNLLIYLGAALQQRVLPLLHYALLPGGYLVLGTSETVGGHTDLFTVVDRKHKIYAKNTDAPRPLATFAAPAPYEDGGAGAQGEPATQLRIPPPAQGASVREQAEAVILRNFALASVTVNSRLEIVHFMGDTDPYLRHRPGTASLNLLTMAREGLAADLRGVVDEAKRTGERATRERVRIGQADAIHETDLHVVPLRSPEDERYYLVA